MSAGATRLLALASLASLTLSCATAPTAPPPPHGAAVDLCRDVEYRGVYRDAEHEDGRRFRLKARVCRSGRVLAEIRGPVGGPGLVAAARPGEARLLFPRDRVAVEGPDEAAFWLEWTGAPISGALLVSLMEGRAPEPGLLEGWRFETTEGASFPEEIRARGPGALALELTRREVRNVLEPPEWPEVPPSFERRDMRGS